jgi:eukaryotic-like serine/threonine-protein kinase
MDPERLRLIEELYHAARECEPGQRSAFLSGACRGDPELRREVESLLAQDPAQEGMLDRPAAVLLEDSAVTILAAGARLGPYQIEAPIGAGGMGQVYRANDTRLGRAVAIKITHEKFSDRFEREARAISALSHPNICTLYDVGPNYLVMELVKGETLAERLKKGPLPLDQVLRYAIEISDALDKAHRKSITHRDLKPSNIMLTKSGAKLLDFGLAKLRGTQAAVANLSALPTEGSSLTAQGTILGTLQYMAPEQVEGKDVDARTDIFAFGVLVYEMATGRKAFEGKTSASVMAKILEVDPPSMASLQPMTPPALDRVVKRCLAKEPEERCQSAKDLTDELKWITEGGPQIALAPIATAKGIRARWQGALLWSVAFLLLAGIAIGFLSLSRSASEPPVYHQVTFRRGTIRSARFAPDGKTIVYSASFEGRGSQIYWTRSESPESTALPFQNAEVHAISSSGELVIGLRRGSTVTMAEVALAGGAPREILDGAADVDWAPDGANLAVAHTVGNRDRIEFPLGNVLYDPGPGVGLRDVRFSPRGDLIAFLESGPTGISIYVVDRSGKRRVVSSGWGFPIDLAWNPVSGEIWFTARKTTARSGALVLNAVSLAGKHRVVARVPGDLFIQDVARDGRVLMKHADWPNSMICLPPGSSKEVDLSWFDFSNGADLSNDGKSILFDESGIAAGEKGGVYLRGTDGSPAVHLGEGYALGLSPDGKWALSGLSGFADRLVLLPVGAGQSRVLKASGLEYHSAEWFPDGKRILISAAEHGHPPRLYVQEIEGGTPHPITPDGVEMGPVSPDGNFVMGRGPGPSVFLYPVLGGPPRAVPGVEPTDQLIRWDAEGKKVFLARAEGPASLSIYRLDPASGRRELWKKLGPADPTGVTDPTGIADNSSFGNVLLTPDGKVYSYSYMRDLSELYVIEGLK